MSFEAGKRVSRLTWSFVPYVDAKGTTPEPSGPRIEAYWEQYAELLRNNADQLQEFQDDLEAAAQESDRETRRTKRRDIDERYRAWQRDNTVETRDRRVAMLAELCDESPSSEQLAELASVARRVFDEFELYLQQELAPKGGRNATTG